MRQLALLGLALGLAAVAAMPGVSAPVAPSAQAFSSYHLRAEDVIEITVLGIPQLDKTVTILPDGTITYPRLNTIRVAGMTLRELQDFLYKGLDPFYNNLDITVTVKSLRTDRVTVRGSVKNPGIYEIHPGWTVRELLAAAGDLATVSGPPAPDQMRATLIRKSGEQIPLNLAQLLAQGGAPDLPVLEPDDLLSVEDLTIQVWVGGQVANPGLISLPPGASALDALRLAGGETEKAALTQASIHRRSQIIPVDLRAVVSGHRSAAPPPLQRFDTLYIPENKARFLVWGGVQKPGAYLIPEDEPLRLTDALILAGGSVPHAKLKEVSVVQKIDGKSVHTVVNLERTVRTGEMKPDVVIRPGDMIYVPDPKQPSTFNPLALLQSAALLFGL